MTLTDDFSFMLGDSGLVLNPDDNDTLPFVDIIRVTGLDNAPYRETERDHEGVDGGFLDAEFEKGRPVILEGSAYGEPFFLIPFLESLKENYSPSTTLIPFYFKLPSLPERVMFVKPRGCRYDIDTAIRHGETPIQFQVYAEDPRQYSSDLSTYVIPWTQAATDGFGFNLAFSFGFGAAGSSDGLEIVIGGSRPTPAIMTITGPVDTPRIVNDTLGKTMLFNTTLSNTDVLTIDTANRTVKLNNSVSRRSALAEPTWFFLEPGSQFIRYQGVTGSGSFLTIQFRNAWR